MCAWPSKAPEAFSDGDSPACLTSDEEAVIAARVAGLGQDRRRADGGQPGDITQPGQAELAQHGGHVGLGLLQLGADALQVTQLPGDTGAAAPAGA